jgi:hypothetical protein
MRFSLATVLRRPAEVGGSVPFVGPFALMPAACHVDMDVYNLHAAVGGAFKKVAQNSIYSLDVQLSLAWKLCRLVGWWNMSVISVHVGCIAIARAMQTAFFGCNPHATPSRHFADSKLSYKFTT